MTAWAWLAGAVISIPFIIWAHRRIITTAITQADIDEAIAAVTEPPAGGRPPQPAARATSPARAPLPGPILRAAGNWRTVRRIDIGDCPNPNDPCMAILTMATKELSVVPCPAHQFNAAEWEARLP